MMCFFLKQMLLRHVVAFLSSELIRDNYCLAIREILISLNSIFITFAIIFRANYL